MKPITIQIGNSDNKLTQLDWSLFIRRLDDFVELSGIVHFSGFSGGDKPWQNACWVITPYEQDDFDALREYVIVLRKEYRQDGVAWIVGETEFI